MLLRDIKCIRNKQYCLAAMANKCLLISELEMHCRCVFNRNTYITFYSFTVSHSGKSYSISMLVCNAAISVIYILANEGMIAMWPRYMRMAQFRQVLRAQQSLLVFLPAQTFEHLNILNTSESLMGAWMAVTVSKVPEVSVVAGGRMYCMLL